MCNNLKLVVLVIILNLIFIPLKTFSATELPNSYVVTEGRISYTLGFQLGYNSSPSASRQAAKQKGLVFAAFGDLNAHSSLYAEFSVMKTQFIKNEDSIFEVTGTAYNFAYRTRLYKNIYSALGFGSVYAFEIANAEDLNASHKSLDLVFLSFVYETRLFEKNIFYDFRIGNYLADPVKNHKLGMLTVGWHFGE